ncbi:MAG: hypothetical protein ROO71_13055 [Balneola sp.]
MTKIGETNTYPESILNQVQHMVQEGKEANPANPTILKNPGSAFILFPNILYSHSGP